MKTFLISTVVVLSVFAARAEVVKIQLPQETAAFKIAPGSDLANAQCMTCHSADYVSMQPPMPRAFWKGAVDKMIGKFGAPIPAEQVEGLVDYLAKNYGIESKESAAPSASKANKARSSEVSSTQALVDRAGCLNCHDPQKKIAPDFKEVAKKYNNRADAMQKITHQISNGGSGQWGAILMPAFTQLSPEETKILAQWVLRQK
jgi:sulfite dehydrogenase